MKTKIILSLAIALTVALEAQPMFANITYSYTGNPFTNATAPYTTSDFVTVSVTLAGPLAPNMPLTAVSPVAFTFFDEVQTFTNVNATFSFFGFATGPTGAITRWNLQAGLAGLGVFIFTSNDPGVQPTFDVGRLSTTPPVAGSNTDSPGTWSTAGSVADKGSTLSLMTLTLMALGVARRFPRAAA